MTEKSGWRRWADPQNVSANVVANLIAAGIIRLLTELADQPEWWMPLCWTALIAGAVRGLILSRTSPTEEAEPGSPPADDSPQP